MWYWLCWLNFFFDDDLKKKVTIWILKSSKKNKIKK